MSIERVKLVLKKKPTPKPQKQTDGMVLVPATVQVRCPICRYCVKAIGFSNHMKDAHPDGTGTVRKGFDSGRKDDEQKTA
jgi:hypothetical protein